MEKSAEILKAIKEIRGNQRVTSQNPEATYDALKKYGRDLVAEVKAGKLILSLAGIPKSAM